VRGSRVNVEELLAVDVSTLPPGVLALRRSALALAEVARRCGVNRATVSRWRAGERTPDARSRLRLLEALGIPFDAWERRR
jgi:transcriptional regulator with XRE-family HTH domain